MFNAKSRQPFRLSDVLSRAFRGLGFGTLLVIASLVSSPAAFAAPAYAPVGPQTNVPVATVTGGGWTTCYSDTYNVSGASLATIQANCNKDLLMLACRPVGNSNFTTLAQGPRADVLFDTGTSNTAHNANGVGWYYNGSYSWGYAPQGQALSRSSCDTGGTAAAQRMCIHTGGGTINGGWRCGAATGLNSNTGWERVILHANNVSTIADAPLIGTATAGNTQATVSFSAPADDGGSAITGYTVTSSPGAIVATGAASPITVAGLTNGASYTFTVVATNALGDSVASAPSNAVVPVGPPALSNFPALTNTFGAADFTITPATSNSAGAFTYTSSDDTVITMAGDVVHIVGIGTATITADQAASGGFTTGSIAAQITIGAATPALTGFNDVNQTFGDADFALTPPTSPSAGAITYSSSDPTVATILGNTVTIVGAGTATITATQAANGNYAAGSTTAQLVVATQAPAITWIGDQTKTFGDATFDLPDPSSNSAGAFAFASGNGSVATISGRTVTITGAGSAVITATQAANGNYSSGSVTLQFTVGTVVPALSNFPNINTTFGNAPFALTAPTSPSAGAITYASSDPGVATIVGNTVTIVGAGNAVITATQAADGNYAGSSITAQLIVAVAAPTQSWLANVAKTFGDASFDLVDPTSNSAGAFTFASSNPAVATVSGRTVTITGAGATTFTATQAADGNYSAGSITVQMTVGAAAPAITWVGSIAKTFGSAPFALPTPSSPSAGSFTYASSNPAVATVSGNQVTVIGNGTATITATQAANGNYIGGAITLQLSVATAAPTLAWMPNLVKTVGEAAFDLPTPSSNSVGAFTYTSSNAAVATISGKRVTIVGDGVTTLTATQAASGNYTAASITATLTVASRPDPTKDASVVGGLQAQVDASVRFATAQQGNINDRLRQQRHSRGNQSSNGLSVNLVQGAGQGLSLDAGQVTPDDAIALPEGWGVWTAGTITIGDRSGRSGSDGFDFRSDGITAGIDWRISERFLLGVAGGRGWNDSGLDDDRSRLAADQKSLALYGLWRFGSNLFLDGSFGVGNLDYDIRRHSDVAGKDALAKRSGDQAFGTLTFGVEHAGTAVNLTGYGRFDASHTTLDAYRESGLGIYDLSYDRQTIDNSTLALGVEASYLIATASGPMRPYWLLEYRDALRNRSDVGLNYVVQPVASDYVLALRSFNDSVLVFGAGIDMDVSTRWKLSFRYRREHAANVGSSDSLGLQISYSPTGSDAPNPATLTSASAGSLEAPSAQTAPTSLR